MACGDDPAADACGRPPPSLRRRQPRRLSLRRRHPRNPSPPTKTDALTRAYVEEAIERYKRDGLDATVAYYSSEESIEGERYLISLTGMTAR